LPFPPQFGRGSTAAAVLQTLCSKTALCRNPLFIVCVSIRQESAGQDGRLPQKIWFDTEK
jgi:hypothetical protein